MYSNGRAIYQVQFRIVYLQLKCKAVRCIQSYIFSKMSIIMNQEIVNGFLKSK